jgi:hypothetical protein
MAVAVVASPCRSLGTAFVGHAGLGGDVGEPTVALVVIKTAAGGCVSFAFNRFDYGRASILRSQM